MLELGPLLQDLSQGNSVLAQAAVLSESLTGEGSVSKLSYTVVGRTQLLEDYWTEVLFPQ